MIIVIVMTIPINAPGSANPAKKIPVWKSSHLERLLQTRDREKALKLLQKVAVSRFLGLVGTASFSQSDVCPQFFCKLTITRASANGYHFTW